MTKKKLIDLMLENNVEWPELATHAVQDRKSLKVCFCSNGKPIRHKGGQHWHSPKPNGFISGLSVKLPELCHNWHCTIVTREQYEAAQVRLSAAKRVTDDANPRTLDAVIANIKECDDKINHHQAELATYTEGRAKFVGELNGVLAGLGIKVVDIECEPVADNGEWPDYCDENGIIIDWDEVPEGSQVECVSNQTRYTFDVGKRHVVGYCKTGNGDFGPIDSEGFATGRMHDCSHQFRLIK